MLFSISTAFCTNDFFPPIVEDYQPLKGEFNVDPERMICAHLKDPDSEGTPGSGIDLSTVAITINGNTVSFFLDELGQNRIYLHTNCSGPMMENAWICAVIYARDYAGNWMTPFTWDFFTSEIRDRNPPIISNISPPDQSTHVPPTAVVYCRVFDYESGIDRDSIIMAIDDVDVDFKIVAVPQGLMLLHTPQQPFNYVQDYTVFVSVDDLAGNSSFLTWTFQTAPQPVLPPTLIHPEDSALLNYQLTDGLVNFRWTYSSSDVYYRLKIKIYNSPTLEIIDLSPSDYTVDEGVVGYDYLIDENNWNQINRIGPVTWWVCKIDHLGGNEITVNSEDFFFSLANSHTVVLRDPRDSSVFFPQDTSPVFSWDPFDDAQSYSLYIARINEDGEFIGEVLTRQIHGDYSSFRFMESEWKAVKPGIYLWAVIANLPNGTQSDFMNYYFVKLRKAISCPVIGH